MKIKLRKDKQRTSMMFGRKKMSKFTGPLQKSLASSLQFIGNYEP